MIMRRPGRVNYWPTTYPLGPPRSPRLACAATRSAVPGRRAPDAVPRGPRRLAPLPRGYARVSRSEFLWPIIHAPWVKARGGRRPAAKPRLRGCPPALRHRGLRRRQQAHPARRLTTDPIRSGCRERPVRRPIHGAHGPDGRRVDGPDTVRPRPPRGLAANLPPRLPIARWSQGWAMAGFASFQHGESPPMGGT